MAHPLKLAAVIILLFWTAGPLRADYLSAVLADNPVSYYRLGEAGGPTANDSSGNGNNGTYAAGGVTYSVPGAIVGDSNSAVTFDGSTGNVTTPNVLGNDFTLELWIKTSVASLSGSHAFEGNGLVWSDVGGAANDFTLGYLNNTVAFTTGTNDDTISATTALNDGKWHYIAATRIKGGAKNLYVDGALEATGTTLNNTLNDNPNIVIGANTLDDRFFNGSVDETAFYTTALTSAQVLTHFNAAVVPEPTSLTLLYFSFAGLVAYAYRRKGKACA
jgi:hypothetical protein